jgi:hypothetical protein
MQKGRHYHQEELISHRYAHFVFDSGIGDLPGSGSRQIEMGLRLALAYEIDHLCAKGILESICLV